MLSKLYEFAKAAKMRHGGPRPCFSMLVTGLSAVDLRHGTHFSDNITAIADTIKPLGSSILIVSEDLGLPADWLKISTDTTNMRLLGADSTYETHLAGYIHLSAESDMTVLCRSLSSSGLQGSDILNKLAYYCSEGGVTKEQVEARFKELYPEDVICPLDWQCTHPYYS